MFISGMSGNEIYCLAQKGFTPGEIAVGNSVYSMGLGGALGAIGRSVSGGEIRQITEMISDGRHSAISRMEQEAQRSGAQGITGVETTLGTLAGFTEFFSQGTAVHKARFPGAQIAVQTQHGAGFEGRGDLRGEGAGFLGGVRDVRLAVAWHGALADRKRAALASVHFSLFSFSGICATIRGNGNDGSFACTAGVAGL